MVVKKRLHPSREEVISKIPPDLISRKNAHTIMSLMGYPIDDRYEHKGFVIDETLNDFVIQATKKFGGNTETSNHLRTVAAFILLKIGDSTIDD